MLMELTAVTAHRHGAPVMVPPFLLSFYLYCEYIHYLNNSAMEHQREGILSSMDNIQA